LKTAVNEEMKIYYEKQTLFTSKASPLSSYSRPICCASSLKKIS